MYKNTSVVIETLKNCSNSNDLTSCDKCPYRKWSKEYYGDYLCKNKLMEDALSLLTDKKEKEDKLQKITPQLSYDVMEFFRKIIKSNKHALFEAGINGSEIYTWSTGRSTPKTTKFLAVLRALGYDVNIVRRDKNE